MRRRASSLLLASLALWAAGPARCGESGDLASRHALALGDGGQALLRSGLQQYALSLGAIKM